LLRRDVLLADTLSGSQALARHRVAGDPNEEGDGLFEEGFFLDGSKQ
jgi:hypothetical protein